MMNRQKFETAINSIPKSVAVFKLTIIPKWLKAWQANLPTGDVLKTLAVGSELYWDPVKGSFVTMEKTKKTGNQSAINIGPSYVEFVEFRNI